MISLLGVTVGGTCWRSPGLWLHVLDAPGLASLEQTLRTSWTKDPLPMPSPRRQSLVQGWFLELGTESLSAKTHSQGRTPAVAWLGLHSDVRPVAPPPGGCVALGRVQVRAAGGFISGRKMGGDESEGRPQTLQEWGMGAGAGGHSPRVRP